ncbi:MAG: hypothetical protein H0W78_17890 [Planctomycetes bacterium]|nr:hypothetical protein [Planctomycetota bacterium]
MRHLIASLSTTVGLALVLVAAPALAQPTLHAEDKKEDHKHAHGHEHALGEITLNGAAFTVALDGHVKPGEEVEIILKSKGALPKGVMRGWVGIESGKGSVKGKAHDEDGGLCMHAEVPNPLPADAKVWVELDGDGGKAKASLALPK